MGKTLNLASPIKVITSGTVPTTTNLKKGEWAYGVIGGVGRFFGNPTGSAVVEFSQQDAIKGVSYNSTTAVLSFTSRNGTTTINLPKENFLSAAAYNPTTKKLTLTLTDNTTVEVSLSELVDAYVASTSGGLELTNTNQFGIKAAGVVESMLASAITTKLNKVLSVSGGAAESGKYISAISVSDHAITVTKAALPVSAADITSLQTAISNETDARETADKTLQRNIDTLEASIIEGLDIYNVTAKHPLSSGYYTLATAINAVPIELRKKGLIITYHASSSGANFGWQIMQFSKGEPSNSSDWNASGGWVSISIPYLTASTSQSISISGYSDAVRAIINASAAVTGGGLKVTSGALELNTDDITLGFTVTEI
jgi:hypothetical protein